MIDAGWYAGTGAAGAARAATGAAWLTAGAPWSSTDNARITTLKLYPEDRVLPKGQTQRLLATATFTNETASGWQQVNFSTPITIAAGTTYVASYHTNVGRYAATTGFFSGGPR